MITQELIERYKQAKKKTILHSITIEPEDKGNLERIASRFNIRLAELIRIIVKEFLKDQKDVELMRIDNVLNLKDVVDIPETELEKTGEILIGNKYKIGERIPLTDLIKLLEVVSDGKVYDIISNLKEKGYFEDRYYKYDYTPPYFIRNFKPWLKKLMKGVKIAEALFSILGVIISIITLLDFINI